MKSILSRISLIAFLLLTSAYAAMAENLIKINDFTIAAGATKTIDIVLVSDVDVTNFNFKIALPEGLSFAGENNDANAKFTDRYTGGTKGANIQTDGGLYVMASSFGTGKAAAGESTLLTIDITASETFESGDITVKDLLINRVRPEAFTVSVTKEAEEEVIVGNKFIIEDFSIKANETKTIDIILATEAEVSNFNLKVYLPEHLSFAGENANAKFTDRYTGGTTGANIQADGGLYVMASSFGTGKAAAGKSVLVSFDVTADASFSGDVITVKQQLINRDRPSDFTVNVALATGIDAISTVESNDAVVYDLAGRRVNANAKGLLIKGGKKYVVK